MATRFIQIFWGLLLVVLDFQVNQIDVLPDLLGYILVALGCRGLSDASPRFSTAAILAWVLVIMAAVSIAIRGDIIPLGILYNVIDCAMMWFLLGGVIELANFRQRPDFSQRASSRRIAYVALAGLSTLLGLTGPYPGEIALALVIGMIVVLCLILHLIHRAIRELSDGPRW
ncbi:hypothetical protein OKA05_07595 [Luteolibacter arcticus]|uniref:Integral membrane protein n=1 Tax=Luteolibacter arcticus TaxID=1581411 RepID=A0ABT3GGL7_9BACT|nr:hypothetical protein [Luteolibacter arcticus]MCW1922413.1 hypothetical protein [Luteolibacter arcticus]